MRGERARLRTAVPRCRRAEPCLGRLGLFDNGVGSSRLSQALTESREYADMAYVQIVGARFSAPGVRFGKYAAIPGRKVAGGLRFYAVGLSRRHARNTSK